MNILTFDIEDWYNHDDYSQDFEWDKFEVRLYEGVDKILEALDRRHLRGTFFCLGWVAEKHPAIIRRIADGGHQIGCHSYQHQLATRFTPAQFEQDTGKAKKLLEDIAGREVTLIGSRHSLSLGTICGLLTCLQNWAFVTIVRSSPPSTNSAEYRNSPLPPSLFGLHTER